MNIRLITALTFSALCGNILLAETTQADSIYTEADAYYELNPVVVTGTGVHQRLKNTPVPVEVISGSDMRNAGLNDLQEALTMMVPTLSFQPNSMGSYLRLNGLSNNHVLILVNGRKLVGDISGNVDLGQIDMNLVKRIEVLNGAASTLYGSDAVGGVINIIMEQPGDVSEFSSNSRYTSKNRFDQGLSLKLRAGKVGSLTSYNYQHSDGWQNSPFSEDGDELVRDIDQLSLGYTNNTLSQRFTYDPNERLSFYADGTYYNRLLDRPVEREGVSGGWKYNTFNESYSWSAGGTYKLGTLGSIKFDYYGRSYGQYYKYMVESAGFLPGEYSLTKRQKYHEGELKGIFYFTENSNTVFGLDYKHENLRRPDANLDKGLGTFSAYAQHEHRFLEHFTGIAGVRYDNYEEIGSRFTPKVALMYNVGPVNVRGTYAMGYRAPGIDELYYHMLKPMGSRYVISLGNPDLKAETSNYISLNAEYRTSRLTVSLTGYMNFIKHMVTSKSAKFDALSDERKAWIREEFPEINDLKVTKVSVKDYYNFAKADVKGLEANVTYVPITGLTLSLNYALAHGKGLNDDGTWQRLNRSTLHTGTFTANYVHGWDKYKLNVNLTGRVQSKTYYPGDVDGDAPGYGIWNLTTRHTFDYFRSFSLTPGIGVDNIFDRRDMRPLNKNFALYSPGRSVVVSLTVTLK